MSSVLKKLAKQELERRRVSGSSVITKLKRLLSPIQLKFVEDPSRQKLARASRRSGKTFADAVYLIIVCLLEPNTPTLYVGLTRDSARGAIWDVLLTILQGLHIPHEALGSVLRITFANGSTIQLFGADATNARNRLRGRKYKLIIADEMGFFQAADALIKSMSPMLADLDGTLVMTSSPGELLAGLFYSADQEDTGNHWAKYSWTLLKNPHFMGPARDPRFASRGEEVLDTVCRTEYGGNADHPAYRREWLGEWVPNTSSLVYAFKPHNIIPALYKMPQEMFGLGLDLGVTSDNALVMVKFSQFSRKVQIVDTVKKSGLLVDDLAALIQTYIDKYAPVYMVADAGGLGKVFVEEFRKKYHMPFINADKTEKLFFQRVVTNDLLAGYIEVLKDNTILDEWRKLVKDEETGEEIKKTPNHASDAFLYIYRKIHNTHLKHYTPPPTEEDKMIAKLEKSLSTSNHDGIFDSSSY